MCLVEASHARGFMRKEQQSVLPTLPHVATKVQWLSPHQSEASRITLSNYLNNIRKLWSRMDVTWHKILHTKSRTTIAVGSTFAKSPTACTSFSSGICKRGAQYMMDVIASSKSPGGVLNTITISHRSTRHVVLRRKVHRSEHSQNSSASMHIKHKHFPETDSSFRSAYTHIH